MFGISEEYCWLDVRRHLRAMALVFVLAGVAILTAGTASARDRPGLPNGETISDCSADPTQKPKLCVSWYNTAHERIIFEIEVTVNGARVNVSTGCQPNFCANFGRGDTGTYSYNKDPSPDVEREKNKYGTILQNLEFSTSYCVRLRTRTAQAGNGGIVSANWTSACMTTRPKPAPPKAIADVSLKYLGAQWLNNPRRQIPEKIAIVLPEITDGAVTITIYNAQGDHAQLESWPLPYRASRMTPKEYSVNPQFTSLKIQICVANISGRKCVTKLADVEKQDTPLSNMPSADGHPATLPIPTPPPLKTTSLPKLPPPTKTVKKTGRPRVFDGTFAVGTNLGGSDYRHVALNDNFPSTCRDLCQKEAPCKAWTWVKPGVQNAKAMCWLKNAIPSPNPDANTTSGVKVTGDLGVH